MVSKVSLFNYASNNFVLGIKFDLSMCDKNDFNRTKVPIGSADFSL